MYKIFVRTLAITLILSVAGASYLWERRARYVSRWMTETLQVESAIKDINYTNRILTLANLHIGTPEGSKSTTALAATEVRVTVDWKSLISNDVLIEEIALDSPLLSFELYSADGSENSWASIINRLNLAGSKEEPSTRYKIQKIVLTDVRIQIENPHIDGSFDNPDPIERIELHDIGSESPLPHRMILATILREVLQQSTIDPALQNMLSNVKALPYDIHVNGQVYPAYGHNTSHPASKDQDQKLRTHLDQTSSLPQQR
ncbi:hypothetical protein SCG7086_BN_00020 [Chlamydiales bacterium SCGC AG-110-P3]|nr:hypothetical protein SCG7086_BN_00020 [Chlamydiales bacterium SCGC AG-110-P3]